MSATQALGQLSTAPTAQAQLDQALQEIPLGPGPLRALREMLVRHGAPAAASDKLVARENEAGELQLHWVRHEDEVTPRDSWLARRHVKDTINASIEAFPGADDETLRMVFPQQSTRQFTDPMSRGLRADELMGIVQRVEAQLHHYEVTPPTLEPQADQGMQPLLRMLSALPPRSFLAATAGAGGQVTLQSRLSMPSDAESTLARRTVAGMLRTAQGEMLSVRRTEDLEERMRVLSARIEDGVEPLTAHEVNQGAVESARAATGATLLGHTAPAPQVPEHTATEAVTVLLDEMDRARTAATPEQRQVLADLDRKAKYQWLAEGLMIGNTADLCLQAEQRLNDAGLQRLAAVARTLAQELTAEGGRARLITRQHDNVYGRVLETKFAEGLNQQPDAAMLRSAADAGLALADTLERLPPHEADGVCMDALRRLTEQYPRNWTTPDDAISRLVNQPFASVEDLCGALRARVITGDDSLRIQQLVAMVGSALGHFSESVAWARRATQNHEDNIRPAQGVEKYYDHPPDLTYGGGITLRHHAPAVPSHQRSRRESVQRVFDFSQPAATHVNALQTGRPIGSGVSGTAGLGLELFVELHRHPDASLAAEFARTGRHQFDLQAAFLDHVKWLILDGGHSLHEALWTVNQRSEALGLDWQRRQEPAAFISNYAQYFESLPPNLRQTVDRALDHAWSGLLAHRRERLRLDSAVAPD
ncbi:hypothetical protein M8A51_14120 [Schlegelella sp. S2-27]|uniref:Uncharacterized protein n=1 Tax=Caldimonas mangrovi TaxID=2944811 RepID=A0ABT0YQQ4_9BURK|nr:hypothetical protein [Caldimonas mangrovi]MCM5680659.1 hypothetical protein [Caldimonas mangrovi]